MGDFILNLYLLLVLVAAIAILIMTYKWIRKIIRLIKDGKFFSALFTLIKPIAIVGLGYYFLVPILKSVAIVIIVCLVFGLWCSIDYRTYYDYYD